MGVVMTDVLEHDASEVLAGARRGEFNYPSRGLRDDPCPRPVSTIGPRLPFHRKMAGLLNS
jgi:hypothetical protein